LRAEYLLWWVEDGRLPLGLGRLDYGAQSGLRLSAGGWLSEDESLGVEASGFILDRRSDAGVASVVLAPSVLGSPESVDATISLYSNSRLWGAEINGLTNVSRGCGGRLDALLGFRHLNLEENLFPALTGTTAVGPVPVAGGTANSFQTQSRFYGGQVGFQAGMTSGRLSADLVGKVALGSTHHGSSFTSVQAAASNGQTVLTRSAAGRRTQNEFTVVPEAELRVGAELTDGVKAFVGYNFLYWSEVIRPGDQAIGTNLPLTNETDFWAQGLNFGVEVKF
jgi:hypothetical protein